MNHFTLRFTLFRIPVEIQPMFWLFTAILGGALRGVSTREQLLAVLLFMLVAAISVLVHEFGHALVGRKYGGGKQRITLWMMGGLAYNEGSRFKRAGLVKMIAAGPAAGLTLFALTVAAVLAWLPGPDANSLIAFSLLGGTFSPPSGEFLRLVEDQRYLIIMIRHLLWVNFWWSLLNLLPILPLDGGRLTEIFVTPQKKVHVIGALVAATAAALGGLVLGSLYMAVIFGYLAWTNFQASKRLA